METVLFASILTKLDTVKATLLEARPFLNINEEAETCSHRVIVIFKILFVAYAFNINLQKLLSMFLKHARNLISAYNNPTWNEIFPNMLSCLGIFVLFKVPLNFRAGEFFIDILMLVFILLYAVEAYKKELQKLTLIIFLCSFVEWKINTNSIEQFKFSTYWQVLSLLLVSYLPLMPNNTKYRHRLNYLYIFLCIFVFYALPQQFDHYALHQTEMQVTVKEEEQTKPECERSKFKDILQNLGMNKESIAQSVATKMCGLELTKDALGKEKNPTIVSSEVVRDHSITKDSKKSDREFGSTEGGNITKASSEFVRSNKVTGEFMGAEIKLGNTEDGNITQASLEAIKGNGVTGEFKGADSKFGSTEGGNITEASLEAIKGNGVTVESAGAEGELGSTEGGNISRGSSEVIEGNRAAGNKEVTNSEFGGADGGNTFARKQETNGSSDPNYTPEHKNLNGARPFQGLIKRLMKTNHAAGNNTTKANELGSEIKNNANATQISTQLKYKPRLKVGNILKSSAGKNINVPKLKVGKFFRQNEGTQLQMVKRDASKVKTVIMNKSKKSMTLKPVKLQIGKSVESKFPLLLPSE